MIPAGGKLSFSAVAEKTRLPKAEVRRLLRHAMAMRVLREPEPEMVAHTKISKFMTIPYIQDWVHFEGKDTWPACTKVKAFRDPSNVLPRCDSERHANLCYRLRMR